MKPSTRIELVILVLLLLLPLLWFAPQALGSRTLLPADNLFAFQPWSAFKESLGVGLPHNGLVSDLILENHVWKSFLVESLRSGQPGGTLWNPRLFAGQPFLAAGQQSALYPLSVLFYALPLSRAYGVFTWLQLGLAAAGMYLLARALRMRPLSSLLAAIVYAFSGFFIVSVNFTMVIAAAAWLPVILAVVETMVRKQEEKGIAPFRPVPYVVGGALAIGMQSLAGHVEITYYILLVTALYATWRLVGLWQRLRASGGGGQALRPILRLAAWLVVMVVLGLGIGAIQLVPLYELVRQSFRAGSASLAEVRGWAWPSRQIITFVLPDFFGNPTHHQYFDIWQRTWLPVTQNAYGAPIDTIDWGVKNYVEGGNYLGLLALALSVTAAGGAGLAALRRRADHAGRHVAFFTFLALVSLLLAFGTPLYAIPYYLLPGIDQLHSAFRWVFPYTLAVAVLAGYGMDAILAGRREGVDPQPDQGTRRLARMAAWFLVAAGAAALVVVLTSLAAPQPFVALGDRLLAWSDLARERGFADGAMAWSYQAAGLARFGGVALLSGISLLLVLADARRRKLWGGFLIAVLVLDVWLVGRHFNPAADPKLLAFEPPVLAWLQEQRDADQPWRFTTFDAPGEKILNANSAMRFGLEDVRGYDSIILKQYVNYMDRIQPQEGDLLYNRIGPILTQWGGQSNYGRLDSPLLTLLGVRYVVTTHTIPNPGYTLAYPVASDGESTAGVGEVRVYRNERAMPRAFVVPEALVAADQQEALTLLERIDPAETVVVEGIAPGSLPPRSSPEVREARISNRTNRELFIDVNISDRGWLVLTDSYFDGWKAYLRPYGAQGEGVDSSGESIETQLPIYRADGTFRAVYLPEAGQWTVRFVYSPRSVLLGVYASFLSVLSIFVLLGWWLWGRYYRGNGSELGTVAKNTSVQLGLSLVNKGIDFAFAMLRLRVLTPAGEGSYAFAITFYTLFEIVTRFGLGTLVTRDVALDKSRTRSYLVNTVALRSGLWLLSLPVMAIAIYFYRVTLGQMTNQELAAILLFSVAMLFALWADSISAVFYAHEKMEYPAGTSTAIAIGKVALGGLVILPPLDWGFVGLAGVSVVMNLVQTIWLYVLLDRNVLAPAAAEGASPEEALAGAAALGTIDETSATAAVAEASAAATVMRMGPSGTPTGHARGALDPSLQRYMLRESGPLMINHLLATLFWRISQLVLRAATNPASLGIFSAGVKYLDGLNVIPAYFTLAIFPVMSRYARSGTDSLPKAYRLALQVLLMTALPIAVFVTFASEPLIRILGGAAYLPDSAIALRIMIWSIPIGFMNSVTQYVLIAVNQQRFLTRAFLIGVAFSATANILLVPRYGYVAAAAVLIPAELSLFIPFAAAVQRYVAHMPWVRLLAPPAIATLANLGATWLAVRVGVPMLLACGIGFAGYAGLLALSGVFRSEEFVPLRAMLRRNLLGVRNRMAGSGPPG